MCSLKSAAAYLIIAMIAVTSSTRSTVDAFIWSEQCKVYGMYPTNVISSTAKTAVELTPAFEAFRLLLGGDNNGNEPTSNPAGGHRQINWDAGIVPFDMPGDFFAAKVTRGVVFATPDNTNTFRVSNPSPDDASASFNRGIDDNKFSSIVGTSQAGQFVQFSQARLFAPYEDNVVVVKFVNPGNINQKATVTGFGAVFTDSNLGDTTKMEFFDKDGCLLATEYVRPQTGGLSFVGVDFGDNAVIASVRITLGTLAIDNVSEATYFRGAEVVVLDDLLYGEPQPVW
jgi:hypothetical protein